MKQEDEETKQEGRIGEKEDEGRKQLERIEEKGR